MELKADPCFQVTLRRGDRVSLEGEGGENQPKERVGAEGWEGEGGIHHGQSTSGCLCPAADPLLAFPRQLEKWDNQGLNPLPRISREG